MFSDKHLNIWESISDLMAGLMMIFLFIGLGFWLQLKIAEEQVIDTKSQIYDDLRKAFSPEELKLWGVEIDKKLSVTFKEPDVLFELNKSDLKPQFQKTLSEFIPRYFEVIRNEKYKDIIAEIRIEGYASKDGPDPNSDFSYFYNMKLSQDRARNVLQYIFWIWQVQSYKDWLRTNITTNGYSHGKASGNNEYDRRVEFRIITKDQVKKEQGVE